MNTIARTILEQIGGKRFAVMTGSRDFVDMGNGLRMSLARNKTSANRRQAESRDKARFGYAEARRRKAIANSPLRRRRKHGSEPSANTKTRNCARCRTAKGQGRPSHRKPKLNPPYSILKYETEKQV